MNKADKADDKDIRRLFKRKNQKPKKGLAKLIPRKEHSYEHSTGNPEKVLERLVFHGGPVITNPTKYGGDLSTENLYATWRNELDDIRIVSTPNPDLGSVNTQLSKGIFTLKTYLLYQEVPIYEKPGFLKAKKDGKAIRLLSKLNEGPGLHSDSQYIGAFDPEESSTPEKSSNTPEETFSPEKYSELLNYTIGSIPDFPREVGGNIYVFNVDQENNTCDFIIEISHDVKSSYKPELAPGRMNREHESLGFLDNLKGKGKYSNKITENLNDGLRKAKMLKEMVENVLGEKANRTNRVMNIYTPEDTWNVWN